MANSDQISGISAQPAGPNGLNLGVSTTLTPDPADGSRLGGITVETVADLGHGQTSDQIVYNASYGYNQLDQRTSDAVTTTVVDDSGNATSADATRGYTYDPSKADSLVSVQDGSGGT